MSLFEKRFNRKASRDLSIASDLELPVPDRLLEFTLYNRFRSDLSVFEQTTYVFPGTVDTVKVPFMGRQAAHFDSEEFRRALRSMSTAANNAYFLSIPDEMFMDAFQRDATAISYAQGFTDSTFVMATWDNGRVRDIDQLAASLHAHAEGKQTKRNHLHDSLARNVLQKQGRVVLSSAQCAVNLEMNDQGRLRIEESSRLASNNGNVTVAIVPASVY